MGLAAFLFAGTHRPVPFLASTVTGQEYLVPVQCQLGRGALGVGLLAPGAVGQGPVAHQDGHGELGLVVGAINGYHLVMGSGQPPTLHRFLELGLGVLRPHPPAAIVSQFRGQGVEDEAAGRFIPLVQVHRRHHRLEGLFQDGVPLVASRLRLSPAQEQVLAQGKAPGRPGQAGTADQGRPTLGQLPLGYARELPVKLSGNYQFQDSVPQEFHTLVGIQRRPALLIEKGTVDQGLLQQAPVLEVQAQGRFQFL